MFDCFYNLQLQQLKGKSQILSLFLGLINSHNTPLCICCASVRVREGKYTTVQNRDEEGKNAKNRMLISETLYPVRTLMAQIYTQMPGVFTFTLNGQQRKLDHLGQNDTMGLIYKPYIRQKTAHSHFHARLSIY